MIRTWLTGSLLILVCSTLLSAGKIARDGFVLAVTSKSDPQRLSHGNESVVSKSDHMALHEAKVTSMSGQLASNETSQESEILALSWREKMLEFFSSKKCISPSSGKQLAPAQIWLTKMTVLVGVMKGGTKAMNSYLREHPNFVSQCDEVAHSKELHFFNNFNSNPETINATDLQEQYGRLIETKCPVAMKSLLTDQSKLMFLDDTPLYMQDSDSVPLLLNCALPKAKIISVLRNPIDRAFSHYNFYPDCAIKTFDEWVDIEIQRLTDAGIVDAKDPYEELLAWQRYNKDPVHRNARRCETFVARGLYAIQCLHYMTALKAAGRPLTDIRFINSEDLQGPHRQYEYDKVLSFLGLENHTLRLTGNTHSTVYRTTMNESTRVKLYEFYRPYNRRLYDLLNWQPVWE